MAWLGAFSTAPAWAAEENATRLSVTIDGRPLDGGVVLSASPATRIVVGVENLGASRLDVDSVRLSGTVLGLTFFAYDTRVQTSIPARGAGTWTVDLDLRDLDGRASGSMPIEVAIRDRGLATVTTASGNAEVRGSLFSVYGLFGLGLVILSALLVAVALLPLGRHALPAKPWQRGLRFVPAGCAVGLFVVFVLSAVRLMAPSTPTDFAITISAALVGFGVGYYLPERGPVRT